MKTWASFNCIIHFLLKKLLLIIHEQARSNLQSFCPFGSSAIQKDPTSIEIFCDFIFSDFR
jgi:hypothetical protein